MRKSKETALRNLEELVERWKKEKNVPWKDWVYGYLVCLYKQNIIDLFEIDEILIEKGVMR